jgi:hypothetical protein
MDAGPPLGDKATHTCQLRKTGIIQMNNPSGPIKPIPDQILDTLENLSVKESCKTEHNSNSENHIWNFNSEFKPSGNGVTNPSQAETRSETECSRLVQATIVIVQCIDGEVWMAERDFAAVCDCIPVLRYLLVGYPGMRPSKFNLNEGGAKSVSFSDSMAVKKRSLGLITMYVLTRPLFFDASISEFDFSDLLKTLMTVGGWDVMNEICDKHAKYNMSKYNVTAIRPYLDDSERFEWRFLLRNQGVDAFSMVSTELQNRGFVVMPTYPGDIGINYRRKKTSSEPSQFG